jgi:CBS domain-containing protein
MRIREIMTQGVIAVGPQDTLDVAARAMWQHDCGAVPVVDETGKVLAMLTDRDACMAAHLEGKRLAEIVVASATTRSRQRKSG